MPRNNGLSPLERRAAMSLSGIFALRMLGLFLVLPVFSLYAKGLEGATPATIGFALGAYGLTQALLQVAFGMASDRFGRKPVITLGLILFATGSFMCAQADSINAMIVGRMVQGSGAIAAVITAMMADLTREEHRTKAMAMLGGSIALSFAFSVVAGPIIGARWGVDVIFEIVGTLATLSILFLWVVVPNPPQVKHHRDMELTPADLAGILANPDLRRLNLGAFVLHMALTAVFVSVPVLLAQSIDHAQLWKVYLPVILVSFAIMVPSTILAEVKGWIVQVMRLGIALVAVSAVTFLLADDSVVGVIAGLTAFFIGFNMLEPVLPSLLTKFAPAGARGTASGVFSTCQFMGPFVGGAVGGWLMGISHAALFGFVLVAALVWLAVAWGMRAPIPYRQVVVPLTGAVLDAGRLTAALTALAGVGEVRVFAAEREAHVRFVSKQVEVDAIFEAVRRVEADAAT
ncbi:MAG: MFS transporter [Nitrospirae bacterium]|nr:MFS transporter [Nitrospirota bacterium]